MPIDPISHPLQQRNIMSNFPTKTGKDISYGYINLRKSEETMLYGDSVTAKDKILAAAGAIAGTAASLAVFMKQQKVSSMFKVQYKVQHMLAMAAAANAGGILLSSIGESKHDRIKKWKEGAFQMAMTTIPMLIVDGSVKLCSRTPKLNNNVAKVLCSIAGVALGSNAALAISNKLRNPHDAKKPKRELKPIDMIANIDDAVAICVLAKIPFADKIHVERALPFIYTICGYRSGTGDKKIPSK